MHRDREERGDTDTGGRGRGAQGSVFIIRGSRFTVHDSHFTVPGSRFTVHDAQFTVHDPQLTVYDSQRERGWREGRWEGGRVGGKEREREGGRAGMIETDRQAQGRERGEVDPLSFLHLSLSRP